MERIKKVFKKQTIICFVLAIVMIASAFVMVAADDIINWSGEAGGGGSGGISATEGNYTIPFSGDMNNGLVGYRFALVQTGGNLVSGTHTLDIFITNSSAYNAGYDENAYHSKMHYSKSQIVDNYLTDTSSIMTLTTGSQSNTYHAYKDTSIFPATLLGTLPTRTDGIQDWCTHDTYGESRVNLILSYAGFAGDQDDLIYGQHFLTVEPIFAFNREKKPAVLTATEIGVLSYSLQQKSQADEYGHKAAGLMCSGGHTDTICRSGCHYDFVGNYGNLYYPLSLHEDVIGNQKDLWGNAYNKTVYNDPNADWGNRISCNDIILKGFGVAILWGDKEPETPKYTVTIKSTVDGSSALPFSGTRYGWILVSENGKKTSYDLNNKSISITVNKGASVKFHLKNNSADSNENQGVEYDISSVSSDKTVTIPYYTFTVKKASGDTGINNVETQPAHLLLKIIII